MDVLPVHNHEYVEIELIANQQYTRLYLPDIANLRFTHIRGFELYTDQNFPTGITGNAVITQALIQQMWITLELYNGKQFVNERPALNFLVNTLGVNANTPFHAKDFAEQKVNYPKSFIDFQPAFTPLVNMSIPISIYYKQPARTAKKDKKAAFNKRS